MDISNIPKFFWYAVSLSILIATSGLTYVAYRSTSVSIEIEGAKIILTSVINEAKIATHELQKREEALDKRFMQVNTAAQDLKNLQNQSVLLEEYSKELKTAVKDIKNNAQVKSRNIPQTPNKNEEVLAAKIIDLTNQIEVQNKELSTLVPKMVLPEAVEASIPNTNAAINGSRVNDANSILHKLNSIEKSLMKF